MDILKITTEVNSVIHEFCENKKASFGAQLTLTKETTLNQLMAQHQQYAEKVISPRRPVHEPGSGTAACQSPVQYRGYVAHRSQYRQRSLWGNRTY